MESKSEYKLLGGGVTGNLFRSIDWLKHPMGCTSTWPESLKNTLNILFHSKQPMFIWWGPELYQFYNDAYLPSFGIGKHPLAMGQRGEECWPEIWPIIKPQIDHVMNDGGATWNENQLVPIFRNGKIEDVYWTYGYSPIFDNQARVLGTLVVCIETTNSVIAAQNILNSQNELVDTLESMSDAFFSVDKNWIVTRINAHHEKATKVARHEQLGKSLLELFFSDPIYKNSIYWKSYHKAMSERVFVRFEDYYAPLDLWTEVRVYPKSDGGLAIFFTDIGERKKIEASLSTERQKLEVMIAQTPAGIALLRGSDFVFEKINEEWKKLVSPREYLGRSFVETYPEIAGSAFFEYLKEVFETGKTIRDFESKINVEVSPGVFEDRYYDFSYIRVNDGTGKPYGVFAHCLDVTQRVMTKKHMEQSKNEIEKEAKRLDQERAQFAAAFQAVAEGIFIFDSVGEPVFMNDSAAKVFGSNSAKELMQRVEFYFERLELRELDGTLVPLSNWPIAKALRGESFKDWRLHAYRTDIDRRWVWSASGELAHQPGRDITLGVVVLRDITEQHQAEEDLMRAKREAESASHAKSAFLANMSHEIRTPLGAILGFTELMKESTSPNERSEFAGIINRNGKSLTKIIDDILDLSKVEAGRLELEQLVFNVKEITQEVADLFAETAAKKNITISTKVDKRTPVTIKSDPTRIRQILINLIGNAVKFTKAGTVEICVEPIFVQDELKQIQFSITDTGLGLSEDQVAKLFEPFSQADESTTRKFGGSGLGLALSKRLAEALGGTVWVSKATLGKGSTFVATVAASPNNNIAAQTENRRPVVDREELDGVKILLVEDVPDNQFLIKSFLKKSGIVVEVANNGVEGIEKAQKDNFDLILMDMQMPVLDGYAATERLRKLGYKKPIIALTAHAMSEERKRTKEAGCDSHLTKPLDFDTLKKTIRQFTDRQ